MEEIKREGMRKAVRGEIARLAKGEKRKRKRREEYGVKYTRLDIYIYICIYVFYVLAVIATIHLRAANDLRASVKRCRREWSR